MSLAHRRGAVSSKVFYRASAPLGKPIARDQAATAYERVAVHRSLQNRLCAGLDQWASYLTGARPSRQESPSERVQHATTTVRQDDGCALSWLDVVAGLDLLHYGLRFEPRRQSVYIQVGCQGKAVAHPPYSSVTSSRSFCSTSCIPPSRRLVAEITVNRALRRNSGMSIAPQLHIVALILASV